MRSGYVAAALTLASMLVLPCSSRGQLDPEHLAIHVTRVEGPLPRRAIRTLLSRAPIAECQSTFMGGPLRFVLHAAPDGTLTMDDIRANEEIGVYVPCVQRTLARLQAAPQSEATQAHVAILFPSLGLGDPPGSGTLAPLPPSVR